MWLSVFIIKLVVDVRFLDTVVAWNGQFGSNFYLNKFTNEGSHQTLFWEKVKIPQTTQTLHTFSDILAFVFVSSVRSSYSHPDLPPPTMGAPSASNSPSALSARAG